MAVWPCRRANRGVASMVYRVKTAKAAPAESRGSGVQTEYALIASCFVLAIVTLVCVIALSISPV
jgi:hypothetical protein